MSTVSESDYTRTTNDARNRRDAAVFDRWLATHEAGVKAEALEGFAALLRERYPEDVFRPMLDRDHRSVNDAMAGRRPNTIVTRDQVSADMMRRAATQADEEAEIIRKEVTP
jgi:hypothetical protein